MRYSFAPCGNSTTCAHTDIFSVRSLHFSLAPHGQVETKHYYAYTDILQLTTKAFLRHQQVGDFCCYLTDYVHL